MITSNQKQWQHQTKYLQWGVGAVLFLLVITLVSFAGYYYQDRYVHVGDLSPVERDIAHMEQVIRDDPQNPEARATLAEYYLNRGMYQEATEQTNQVLALYPEHEGSLLVAGVAYTRLDQPRVALEPLEQFVALRKDRPTAKTDTILEMAYYFLGESYMKLDKPVAAISVLQEALVINRFDADALYQLGLAYQDTNQPKQALDVYHQAVRLVPNFTEAYRGMIESYSTLGQADYVAYARGMEALTLEDYETAQTHLKYVSQIQPEFAPVFLGLALAYEKTGQMDAALVAAQRAIQLAPDDFAAQQAFGRIERAPINVEEQ